jgi:hypothetical protein
MSKLLQSVLFIAGITGGQAVAQTACPMTYATFEYAVPHLDLQACPAEFARTDRFCRASVGGDALHVFVFSHEGEQCLVAVKSYKEGEYQLSVK